MAFNVYSSKDVNVAWGPVVLQGYSSGDFLTVEYNSDVFTADVGSDGGVSRSLSPDKTATVTLTLKQESPSNDVLAGVLALYKNGEFIEAPMIVTDPSGSLVAIMRGVAIQNDPTTTLGPEAGDKEWTFHVSELDYASIAGELSDILSAEDLAAVTADIAALAGKVIN